LLAVRLFVQDWPAGGESNASGRLQLTPASSPDSRTESLDLPTDHLAIAWRLKPGEDGAAQRGATW